MHTSHRLTPIIRTLPIQPFLPIPRIPHVNHPHAGTHFIPCTALLLNRSGILALLRLSLLSMMRWILNLTVFPSNEHI